ncbi:MAG TPA: metallophosphoesterase [Polyangia bacterium]|nr:metallophosphoesterase [Polyangia bacterium]
MLKRASSPRIISALVGTVMAAVAACSPADPGSPTGAADPTANVGSIKAALDLGPGLSIATVTYTIVGPGGFSRTGAIDVSHSTTLSALISGIPAGIGYTITLSATTANGGATCAGAATFNVTAHATNTVMIHLTCSEPSRLGSVMINGTINICPVADGLGANPAEAFVGTGIRLSGTAHDSDAGPAALTYSWSATAGVFDDRAAQNPLFTCSTPGMVTITMTVSDGDPAETCPDSLSVTVGCTTPAPRPFYWVELGPGGATLARAATPEATCPSITIDSVPTPMSVRLAAGTEPVRTSSASPVLPSAFSMTACELTIPPGASSATIFGQPLPLPKAHPQKIVVIGDTGCRLKTGNPWQACSDTTQWPFPVVADAAAGAHPDLVVHVGDYHYRENQCPSTITGCQGSPWSYGWDAWEADLFRPAENLMHAAPWVMVRGNHEECLRAGQGWFRYLDPRPYSEMRSCNDPANDNLANYNDPYAVPFGGDSQFVVFDSARSTASALNPMAAADMFAYSAYAAELQQVAALAADPNVFSVWANHHPLLGYAPVAGGNPAGGQASILSVMNALNGAAYYPPNIKLALHGHVHLFEAIDFSTPHPPTIVAGMGGDNLDLALPDPFPLSVQPAAGVAPDLIAQDNVFGFVVMEKIAGAWTFTAHRLDGTIMSTCALSSADKLSCAPTGYLH